MSDLDVLSRIESWFSDRCDGDWEHGFGIKIETLDNPGWMIRVALEGTRMEGVELKRVSRESQGSWVHHWADGEFLHVACDVKSLHSGLVLVMNLLDDPA